MRDGALADAATGLEVSAAAGAEGAAAGELLRHVEQAHVWIEEHAAVERPMEVPPEVVPVLRAQLERAHAHSGAVQEQARLQEAELHFEIDKLRSSKRELEGHLAGVDLKTINSEHESVRQAE